MCKADQIAGLPNGRGIQYLLDEAYKILHNPLMIIGSSYNHQYELFAYTDVPCNDHIWQELITTASFSPKTLKLFAEENFAEQLANSDTVVTLRSEKLPLDRLIGNIVNAENINIATLVMMGCGELYDGEIIRAFEELTNKISSETHGDEHYISYGRLLHETTINGLINGEIFDPICNTYKIQTLYDGFEDYIYVLVVDTKQSSYDENNIQDLIGDALKHNRVPFKLARRKNQLVILASSNCKYPSDAKFFGESLSLLDSCNLFAGISDSFENLYELRCYYKQAVNALTNGTEQGCRGRIFMTENETERVRELVFPKEDTE